MIGRYGFHPALRTCLLLLSSVATPSLSIAEEVGTASLPQPSHFSPTSKEFTGRILRDRVRLRVLPSLDSAVAGELDRGTLLIVTGSTDDFYAVRPLENLKGYIFRSYLIDGVVEGDRVNLRLMPSVDAPVIAQLKSGTRVSTPPSTLNNKWIEVNLPETVSYYVSKNYLEPAGPPELFFEQKERKQTVANLLREIDEQAESQLALSFEQIDLTPLLNQVMTLVNGYRDFPEAIATARDKLDSVENRYLQQKVEFLRHMATSQQVETPLNGPLEPSANLERLLPPPDEVVVVALIAEPQEKPISQSDENNLTSSRLTSSRNETSALSSSCEWDSREKALYNDWKKKQGDDTRTLLDFYHDDDAKRAVRLDGELSDQPQSCRAGEWILYSRIGHRPVAFLYSLQIDLSPFAGKVVSLYAVERPNEGFSLPSYAVFAID